MEYLQPVLDWLGWFFKLPPVNQVLGAFIAGGLGLGAFFVQSAHRQRMERRRIARALLQEILMTGVFLSQAKQILYKARRGETKMREHDVVALMPPDRKIFSMMGAAIGDLSEQAAASVVACETVAQLLGRAIQLTVAPRDAAGLFDRDEISAESCGVLFDHMTQSLGTLSSHLDAVIRDAYGSDDKIPEDARRMIQEIQSS